jgi:hypothetical protein
VGKFRLDCEREYRCSCISNAIVIAEAQNPGKLKREEETMRLERSIKTQRRALTEKRAACAAQADQVAQLQADLDVVKACESFSLSSSWQP